VAPGNHWKPFFVITMVLGLTLDFVIVIVTGELTNEGPVISRPSAEMIDVSSVVS